MLGILTGQRGLLPRPQQHFMDTLNDAEQQAIEGFLAVAAIGGPERVQQRMLQLAESTGADELMLVSDVYDGDLRLRSLEIAANAMKAPVA